MDDFALTEEQELVKETVAKLVEEEIAPRAIALDEAREFARDALARLAELGMLGLPVAEEHGGAGMGAVAFAIALEELARGCGSTAALVAEHAGACGKALEGTGAAVLEEILTGACRAAYVAPGYGVRARSLDTGGAVLDGTAELVIGGAAADVLVVAAREGTEALLVVVGTEGVARVAVPALGLRAAAPARVCFETFEAPANAVVARGTAAEAAFARAHAAVSLGAGAIAVGLAAASRERAARHAEERIAFGKPLAAQEAVRDKLATCRRRTAAARAFVLDAARALDEDREEDPAVLEGVRLEALDAAILSADEAIQIHGGYGFTVEYEVERHYRDAMTLAVVPA